MKILSLSPSLFIALESFIQLRFCQSSAAFDASLQRRWQRNGRKVNRLRLLGYITENELATTSPLFRSIPNLARHSSNHERSRFINRHNIKTKVATSISTNSVTNRHHALSSALAIRAGSSPIAAPLLEWQNLFVSTLVLVLLGVLPLSLTKGMGPLAKTLLTSASRCALQLSFLGSILLTHMMGVTNPLLVVAWIFGVGLLAGREAVSRIQYRYPKMRRNLYGSVLASGFSVLGLTLSLNIFGKLTPWFDPKTWIPVAGMLFGNTLNASALAASAVTKLFATQQDTIELYWMRGASTQEALAPLLSETYKLALLPTINGLAATGIIHIPGTMSGQILAGNSPQQASRYQIIINFLIASTSLASVQLILRSTVASIVDKQMCRLRCGVLETREQKKNNQETSSSLSDDSDKQTVPQLILRTAQPILPSSASSETTTTVNEQSTNDDGVDSFLELRELSVPRAHSKINLKLRKGDRIGISGPSGSGKTQILRTVLCFEKQQSGDPGNMIIGPLLGVKDPSNQSEIRRRVSLVTANRPNLEGTPNQFYQQILNYRTQKESLPSAAEPKPSDIAQQWGLTPETFDREWRTLSGGESQRASLAIALALKPKVLLLDESLSLLDEATALLVEATLVQSEIPMIVVTHSEEQLNRFCTQKMELH